MPLTHATDKEDDSSRRDRLEAQGNMTAEGEALAREQGLDPFTLSTNQDTADLSDLAGVDPKVSHNELNRSPDIVNSGDSF
jgi:hypothetical protein